MSVQFIALRMAEMLCWDSGILHFAVALEHDLPHVVLWAGIEQLV